MRGGYMKGRHQLGLLFETRVAILDVNPHRFRRGVTTLQIIWIITNELFIDFVAENLTEVAYRIAKLYSLAHFA